jgi:hypothetical protein
VNIFIEILRFEAIRLMYNNASDMIGSSMHPLNQPLDPHSAGSIQGFKNRKMLSKMRAYKSANRNRELILM